ncbi:hypothetical protein HY383_00510 [Candidatus Daviesbacteria bacterium]|nr:hypothetical protein [Candidatus Daviesbacteria bacterium]
MTASNLRVRIISPQELILDTRAYSVSSKNSRGNFDILPAHANFITIVENEPIIIRSPQQKPLTFKFPLAIILTMENNISIYTYASPKIVLN